MTTVIYNDNDPRACEWLRELITMGAIANGHVLECSISDLAPSDVRGATQFHAFAGIGTWSHALRLAGVADHDPVWTVSCPCQPFSISGTGGGTDDERHLWPDWYRLAVACRPGRVFGEQVSSAQSIGHVTRQGGRRDVSSDGLPWFDHVQNDLENARYAVGAVVAPAACVGAPHVRHRLFYAAVSLEHADHAGSQGWGMSGHSEGQRPAGTTGVAGSQRAVNGFWADADWLRCGDDRWRPVEPGLEPLAYRPTETLGRGSLPGLDNVRTTSEARIVRCTGYGNSIVADLAAEFIKTTI